MSYDWSQFTVHTYISRPTNEVFAMWSTCSGLERFFIKTAQVTSINGLNRAPEESAQSGDQYLWRWIHDYELGGRVLAVTDTISITYTFGEMEFTVEVQNSGQRSLVKLKQYNIPHMTEEDKATSHLNCRSCWVFFLTNLKSVMENGYDLRESDPALSDTVAVHFKPPA